MTRMRAVRSGANGCNPASHPGLGEPPELLERRAREQRAERAGGARAPIGVAGMSDISMASRTRPRKDGSGLHRHLARGDAQEQRRRRHTGARALLARLTFSQCARWPREKGRRGVYPTGGDADTPHKHSAAQREAQHRRAKRTCRRDHESRAGYRVIVDAFAVALFEIHVD